MIIVDCNSILSFIPFVSDSTPAHIFQAGSIPKKPECDETCQVSADKSKTLQGDNSKSPNENIPSGYYCVSDEFGALKCFIC